MDNDDRPVGRILSRREFLALLAVTGGGVLAACTGLEESQATTSPVSGSSLSSPVPGTEATTVAQPGVMPACIVRPEMTEGPYFVDDQLNRSDIRVEPSDGTVKPGVSR